MEDKILFKNGRYEEIIDKYKFTDSKNLDEWQLYWLAKSLYKMKNYGSCHIVYKSYKQKCTGDDLLRDTNLWCFYHSMINSKNSNDMEKYFKTAEFIILNSSQEDKYSPYVMTVKNVINTISEHMPVNYKMLYKWTNYLDPKLLTSAENVVTFNGEEKKTASDKEKWYAKMTKTCENLGRYDECITLCEEALEIFNDSFSMGLVKLHNDNDVWFRRRIALSKACLGYDVEAMDILEELILKKDYFVLYSDIAALYEKKNEHQMAQRYYMESLLKSGSQHIKLVNFIEKTGDLLSSDGRQKEAKLHFMMARNIREENKWRVSAKLNEKLANLREVQCAESQAEVRNLCRKLWLDETRKHMEQKTGFIEKILPDNKHGFIKCSDNQSYYFSIKDIINRRDRDFIDKNVVFNPAESFDKKKNRKSYKAINIELIL